MRRRLFRRSIAYMLTPSAKITEIKRLYFRYRVGNYSNGTEDFSIEKTDDGYFLRSHRDGSEITHDAAVDGEFAGRIEALLREYNAGSWNGYDGNDMRVLDGRDFELTVSFADGSELRARGYAAFPKNFREVREGLEKLFLPFAKDSEDEV